MNGKNIPIVRLRTQAPLYAITVQQIIHHHRREGRRNNKGEHMKHHIEYDDFGEYVEMYDGEGLYVVEDRNDTGGLAVELILFESDVA